MLISSSIYYLGILVLSYHRTKWAFYCILRKVRPYLCSALIISSGCMLWLAALLIDGRVATAK